MKNQILKKTLLLCLSLLCLSVQAQTEDALNDRWRAVYGEILGPTVGIGANYDSRFSRGSHWGYRAGFGLTIVTTTSFYENSQKVGYTIPLEVNYLVGKRRNYLELGIGSTLGIYSIKVGDDAVPNPNYENKTYVCSISYANIGYRHVSKKGFLFRAGLTPMTPIAASIFSSDNDVEVDRHFVVLPYVGFGYSF